MSQSVQSDIHRLITERLADAIIHTDAEGTERQGWLR